MNEDCNNCKQAIITENLKEEVNLLKEIVEELKKQITDLFIKQSKTEEQTKTIFNILNEIKDSIKDIGNKLEKISEKPAEEYSKIKLAIITSVCSGIVGIVLGLIFSKK